jgi:hypothetical protein
MYNQLGTFLRCITLENKTVGVHIREVRFALSFDGKKDTEYTWRDRKDERRGRYDES